MNLAGMGMAATATTAPALRTASGVAMIGLIIVLAALPVVVSNRYVLHVLIMVFLYAYLGNAWDILGGYTGQFSFGPALFFGIGAYASSLAVMFAGLTPWVGMLLGAACAALAAFGVGYVCFRFGLRGLYFSITTLFLAEMARVLSANYAPGQAQGIQLPFKGDSLYDLQFTQAKPYYYIALLMLLGMWGLLYRLERSRLGYYLVAIRESDETAQSLCVNTMKYKLLAIILSACLTALGGTFYAQYVLFVDPSIAFGNSTSVEMIIRPIAGGMGTILGPFLGSLVLTPMAELTRELLGRFAGIHLAFYGAILIGVILLMPSGLAGVLLRRTRS